MRVECPHCGAKGELDESRRPPGPAVIRCLRCGGAMPLRGQGAGEPFAGAVGGRAASPVSDPPAGAAERLKPTDPAARHSCAVCNRNFPLRDMARFGPSLVCVSCSARFTRLLEQGAARPGSLRYAGFWVRSCAKVIDTLIVGAIMAGCFALKFAAGPGVSVAETAGASRWHFLAGIAPWGLLAVIFAVVTGTCFVTRFGATPGKMAFGLLVVNPEGDRIAFRRALGRSLAEMLSASLLFTGYLLMLLREENRALHDSLSGTRVVREP